MDRFSFTSEQASSLQPPDGNGVKAEEKRRIETLGFPVDLEKRVFELEAHNKRLNEENQMLVARNLELDEKNREQRRLIEETEELLIVLKDEAMSMSGTEGKLNEKYERLKKKYEKVCEDHESSERKWRVELKKVEEELFDLKIEKKKIEIDLQAARKGGNVNAELLELMNDREVLETQISQLMNDQEVLEREKLKIEEKLEELVAKWMQMTPEIREAKVAKVQKCCLFSGDTGMANDDLGRKVGDDLKGSASQKRKSEAVTCSEDKQADTKRSKYDGPRDGKMWKNEDQMRMALDTDFELCMKSICALYRKHKSLGPWKNRLDGDNVFKTGLVQSGVNLAVFLTSGDSEGKLKKSVADIEREDSKRLNHCRFIAKRHCKELFEIYSSNMDPLYLP